MARIQVKSGLDPQRLRPTATPVDTFITPSAENGLAQLAQGLSAFEPSLAKFTAVQGERSQQENLAKGEALARELDAQRLTFREAVKQGKIDPHENPWFVQGAKIQMGRAAAGRYGSDLMEQIVTDPELQETGDLAAFDEKVSKFREQWLEANAGDARDGAFDKGFGAIADGYMLDARRSFAAAAGARMEKRAGESLQVIIGQALVEGARSGDMQTAVAIINGETADFLKDNPRAGRIANIRAVAAVEDWARLNYKDVTQESLTALLEQINAGPGNKLFGTSEAKQMVARVSNDAIQMRQRDNQVANAKQAKERVEAERTVFGSLSEAFLTASDPSAVDIAPFLKAIAAVDPISGPKAVHDFRAMFMETRDEGDPVAFEGALLRVYGVNPDQPGLLTLREVSQMQGSLSNAQVGRLLNEITARDSAGPAVSPAQRQLNDLTDTYKSILLRQMGVSEFGSNDPEVQTRSGLAHREFLRQVVERREEMLKLSPTAMRAELDAVVQGVFATHANEDMKQNARETGSDVDEVKKNASKGEFKDAIAKVTPGDAAGLENLRSTFNRMNTPRGRAENTTFSDADLLLLLRLGIPRDVEKVRQFFLELDLPPTTK